MKLNKFFMGLLGALALTACSNEEPANNGGQSPELGLGDNYVAVSIEMPTAAASRTVGEGDNGDDKFNYGTPEESEVKNVVFFFFDDKNNCIDVQKLGATSFKTPEETGTNPKITKWGTAEVRLKAGMTYKKVAIAINTPAADANELKREIRTFADLEARHRDYVTDITAKSSNGMVMSSNGMVMSSSVYYNMDSESVKPTAEKKICLVEITEKNIYTSAERPTIDQMIKDGKKEYVDLFVERVVAKVIVNAPTFDMNNYYVSKDGVSGEVKYITVYDHMNTTSERIYIRPVIKGMMVNVLTPGANLIKPISIDEIGYNTGNGDYKTFQWNDPKNKRSYWASTNFNDDENMIYYSWNQTLNQNMGGITTQYIHPNTLDYSSEFGENNIRINEGGSKNTKVMVIAELHKYSEDGLTDNGPLDLVKYGTDYMLPENLLAHAANLINIAVRTYDWENAEIKVNDVPLTAEQLKNVKIVVNNSFLGGTEAGLKAGQFELGMLNADGHGDWEAAVKKVGNFTYSLVNTDNILTEDQLTAVNAEVGKQIDAALATINNQTILYWKDGKTYYFTNIRHQGFYGMAGNSTSETATDFVYGVVRNHIYDVNMTGVYGLGTPVIDPAEPIDPDRPKNERPSYIKARINILPWRVVTNNAVIH